MTRTEYRKARALVRANGLAALSELPPANAALMFAILRPAGDALAQRADLARSEPSALAFRLTSTQKTKRQLWTMELARLKALPAVRPWEIRAKNRLIERHCL